MRRLILVLCFSLGILIGNTSAADTPQMSCNLTTEFALQLAGCVFKPFEELIDMLPLSTHATHDQDFHPFQKYTLGKQAHFLNDLKKAKSVSDVFKVAGNLEQDELSKIKERLIPNLKRNEDEDERVRISMREHVLEEILKNVDFDKVADHALIQLMGTAGALRIKMMELVADQQLVFPGNRTWEEFTELICSYSILPIAKRACNMMKCIPNFDETSMEDGIQFAQCFFICSDVPIISRCMHDAFEGCEVKVLFKLLKINLDWLGDLITRVMVDYLQLDTCAVQTSNKVTVTEGGKSAVLKVTSLLPPAVHCFSKIDFLNTPLGALEFLVQFIYGNTGDCDVELQISTTNYIRGLVTQRVPGINVVVIKSEQDVLQDPVCRSGQAIPEVVLGWHEYANRSAGVIKLTNENWNETFEIPVDATIDYKVSIGKNSKFFQNDFITVKVKGGLFTKHSVKVPLTRTDKDELKFRSCWIVNGPHVRSFDGQYYNNLYEGHFVMYRHKKLPYEVQVVNQRCSEDTNVTCTCAASVRSGDDVLTVDACRRKDQSPGDVIKKVVLYLIGDLTPGTRIFRHDDGITYRVLLPHGTLVTISSTDTRLNVWIRPSAYDGPQTIWKTKQAQGFCGDFNGDPKNDYFLRNGKKYKGKDNKERQQPRGFLKDWRIKDEDEIILWGVNGTNIDPGTEVLNYCSCSHIVLMGVTCNCGHNNLVSDCDINKEGQLPDLFPRISKLSLTQFYTNRPHLEEEDIIDFNDNYLNIEPDEYVWAADKETETFCRETIMEDPVVKECEPFVKELLPTIDWDKEFEKYRFTCEEDWQLINSTEWYLSSKMAARQHCHDLLDLTSYYSEKQIRKITDLDCPNDCRPDINNATTCVNGSCVCDAEHSGPDCSLADYCEPEMTMPEHSPCDTRYQNCSYATIYGKNFVKDKVSCHILKDDKTVPAEILSENQISCQLPKGTSHTAIRVLPNEPTRKRREVGWSGPDDFKFVPYDSLCFEFSDKDGKVEPRQEEDHCLVGSVCYRPLQASPDDECYVCTPTTSKSVLQYSQSEKCQQRLKNEQEEEHARRKERNLRIVFSCLMCGAVVIVTIILFLVSRVKRKRKAKQAGDKYLENGNVPIQEMHTELEVVAAPHSDSTHDEDSPDGVDNPAMDDSTTKDTTTPNNDGPTNPNNAPADINAREMAEFWRIKHLSAQKARTRTNSQGSRASSMGSTGIGGSGPSHFGQSRVRSSTGGSYGMGGGGPTHLGGIKTRTHSTGTDEEDIVDNVGLGGGGPVAGIAVRL